MCLHHLWPVSEGNTTQAGALASAAANPTPNAVLGLQSAKCCSLMSCGMNMDCYFPSCCQGEALKLVWHKQGEPGMPCWAQLPSGTALLLLNAPPPPKGSSLLLQPFCDAVGCCRRRTLILGTEGKEGLWRSGWVCLGSVLQQAPGVCCEVRTCAELLAPGPGLPLQLLCVCV